MRSNILFPTLLLLFVGFPLLAQDFSGDWKGKITLEGRDLRYDYRVAIQQEGHRIQGTTWLQLEGSTSAQKWQFEGVADAQYVRFSETSPVDSGQGCWKGMKLRFIEKSNVWRLEGPFVAPGCAKGNVTLSKAPGDASPISEDHPLGGRWVGVLTQEDKDYDFSYELDLYAGQQGSSSIAVEHGGGVGDHKLTWSVVGYGDQIHIQETQLLFDGAEPGFYWCFKQATLTRREEADQWVLEGDWEGTLYEGTACSPGHITLYQPKEKPEETAPELADYAEGSDRQVQVSQTLSTPDHSLQLSIWDNAQEDGDIVTVFVNGNPVLEQIMTTEEHKKYEIALSPGDNYLIFHAENLGSSPPNTAAIALRAAGIRRRIILRSDLQTSGAVLIKVE
ncbi:MAG: hypothetical protein AAFQ98_12715 [Bacteroidota bacterium]